MRTYTPIFEKNIKAYLDDNIRTIVNEGGTSSSKTFSELQLLREIAENSKTHLLISVVSESMPHLKRGVIRDFIKILENNYELQDHNKTDQIFQIGLCEIEFFSAEDKAKVHGARRDILYCNEVNNIPKDTYDQLCIRTENKIFVDFNPVQEFYIHNIRGEEDVAWIHSTYKDNPYLSERIIKDILNRGEKDPNFKRVYIDGLVGNLDGLIYPKFEVVDSMPETFQKERLGLDFGYTNDPTALIHLGINGDDLYLDELIYETGLVNITNDPEKDSIAKRFNSLKLLKNREIQTIAECAEPKSIVELSDEGIWIEPCVKGKDSIFNGIQQVKQYNIKVTKNSTNIITELRNYQYAVNKLTGQPTNKPVDSFNHAMDAMRYALNDIPQLEFWDV